MEIIIGKTAGFCFGVANAVNKTNKILDENSNVYCLGELVHNKQVTKDLQGKGLNIIENVKSAKKNVIIRSHGWAKNVYEEAQKMQLNIIDLTCPKVLKIHNIAKEYSKKGYYILLIGKKEHPEIIGTISYCGKYSKIIEKQEQINDFFDDFQNTNSDKLLIIAQTTFSLEKYNTIVSLIKEEISKKENIIVEIKNTICDATKSRQNETEKISAIVDAMIIIGGKHSSNTNKLYEIAKENCKKSILIEDSSELNIKEMKQYNKIGIMAGASTPKKSIETVVEILSKM